MLTNRLATALCAFALSFSCSTVCFAALEQGDEGQEVLAIQKRLVELHYPIEKLDGDFGESTEKAVIQFQKDMGLDPDGVVGPGTYKLLMKKEMPVSRGDSIIRKILRAGYAVIGTPYVFGGETPGEGFDCSGFTRYCFEKAGIALSRAADEQFEEGRKIPVDKLRVGDLVFFETYEEGVSHVGIYIGDGQFIHSGSSTGVAIADMSDPYWDDAYYGACRIKF